MLFLAHHQYTRETFSSEENNTMLVILLEEEFYFDRVEKGVNHLENYTSTPHEDTMIALKYCSSPVLSCHRLLQTHPVITLQDEKKQVIVEKESIVEF
eukprot:9853873-Ditylum_brightwellii.AAC.1